MSVGIVMELVAVRVMPPCSRPIAPIMAFCLVLSVGSAAVMTKFIAALAAGPYIGTNPTAAETMLATCLAIITLVL